MREERGKLQGWKMSNKEGNRFIRRALLFAGMMFLLLFVLLSALSWNRYFRKKPKDWKEWKGGEETYTLSEQKNILFFSSYDPADEIFSQQLEGWKRYYIRVISIWIRLIWTSNILTMKKM